MITDSGAEGNMKKRIYMTRKMTGALPLREISTTRLKTSSCDSPRPPLTSTSTESEKHGELAKETEENERLAAAEAITQLSRGAAKTCESNNLQLTENAVSFSRIPQWRNSGGVLYVTQQAQIQSPIQLASEKIQSPERLLPNLLRRPSASVISNNNKVLDVIVKNELGAKFPDSRELPATSSAEIATRPRSTRKKKIKKFDLESDEKIEKRVTKVSRRKSAGKSTDERFESTTENINSKEILKGKIRAKTKKVQKDLGDAIFQTPREESTNLSPVSLAGIGIPSITSINAEVSNSPLKQAINQSDKPLFNVAYLPTVGNASTIESPRILTDNKSLIMNNSLAMNAFPSPMLVCDMLGNSMSILNSSRVFLMPNAGNRSILFIANPNIADRGSVSSNQKSEGSGPVFVSPDKNLELAATKSKQDGIPAATVKQAESQSNSVKNEIAAVSAKPGPSGTKLPPKKRKVISDGGIEIRTESPIIFSESPKMTNGTSSNEIETKEDQVWSGPITAERKVTSSLVFSETTMNSLQPAIGGNVSANPTATLLQGLPVAKADEDGDLPIHIAVIQGDIFLVRKLIALMLMASVSIDTINNLRQTPLHLAIITRSADLVELLLESGASASVADRNGHNSVHLCLLHSANSCLEVVLRMRNQDVDMNARDYDGFTPLHMSVSKQNEDGLSQLLCAGAGVDTVDGKSGRTALFHAAESGSVTLCRLLLDGGADVNVPNYAGFTAVQSANGRCLDRVVALLVHHGAEACFPGKEVAGKEVTLQKNGKKKFIN